MEHGLIIYQKQKSRSHFDQAKQEMQVKDSTRLRANSQQRRGSRRQFLLRRRISHEKWRTKFTIVMGGFNAKIDDKQI